jgi:signal transduction histidine kinase
VRIKPLILLILIVVLPLGGLIWLGLRVARDDEAALQRRFEKVFAVQLRDIDGVINRHFESLSTELRGTARQIRFEPDDIRAVIRTAPQVRQVIVLDREGLVLHPDPATPLSLSEREFLNEAQELIQDRDLIHASSGQFDASTQRPITPGKLPRGDQRVSSTVGSSSPDEGWHTWYWGRGVHLIFWQRRADGSVVGLLVERGRWMADLVAALPDTVNRQHDGVSIATTSRFRLVDSMGQSMYEWGEYEPPEVCTPLAEMAVSSPLNSWRLQAVVSESLLAGESRGTAFQLTTGICAAAIGLSVLAVFFWREYSREVRQASQRVSFVNQVSHELKTPLTNIRMYADLLAADLEHLDASSDGKTADRLRVIVSESQRLSRLISNVLTFGRQQRETLVLRPRLVSVDELVRRVVEQFVPTLERLNIKIDLQLDAESPVRVDEDAVEQILVNLISNVEKYAAEGGLLKIETCREGSSVRIVVTDAGQGIPVAMQRAVFEPFVRVSSRLEDAAGTGIGLSIARDLARLHGGDLRIVDCETGASFCVELLSSDEEREA